MSITTIPHVRKDLGNGHFMVTTAELDDGANKVQVHTDATCTNKLGGFHGQVRLIFFGDHGQNLGSHGVDIGVGQAPLLGAAHAYGDWTIVAPPGTQGLGMAQFWHPHWPLAGLGDAIGGAFNDIGGFFNGIPQWVHQNAGAIEIAFVVIVVAGTVLCLAGVLPSCAVVLTVM